MLTFPLHLHVPQRKIYGSIITGSTSEVVPPVKIKCLRKPVLGATTGPATGVNDFPIETEKCLSSKDGNSTEERTRTVAGIPNWSRPLKQACGEAITLYDHIPGSSEHHGDPIADIYAVIARSNNAILALAEGCNWGPKSRQAACSAVQGCVGKLNDVLFSEHPPENIQQVVACIQESFDSAMESVTKCGSIMTSLCVAVVCPLAEAMEHKRKLEHAAVVAYQVGFLADSARYTRTNMFLYSPTVADLKVDAECEDSS
eukprot:Em0562g5a